MLSSNFKEKLQSRETPSWYSKQKSLLRTCYLTFSVSGRPKGQCGVWNAYETLNENSQECMPCDTVWKMKFSIKDFLSKCDQIRSFLRIWSYLLEKSLMENFIFLCSTSLYLIDFQSVNRTSSSICINFCFNIISFI